MGRCKIVQLIYDELQQSSNDNHLPAAGIKNKTLENINKIIKSRQNLIPALYRYSSLDIDNLLNIKN